MSNQNQSQELVAELARLRAENQALKTAEAERHKPRELTIKVGEKGGVCVYGLGRFPTVLYKSQMLRLLDHEKAIRAFIAAHPELKEKVVASNPEVKVG
jgi:hypothetical protein